MARKTIPATPDGLDERGRRVWRDVAGSVPDLTAAQRLLLAEACRCADRLERLDRVLRGDETVWARLVGSRGGDELTVVVDGVLAEARQQQNTLRGLIAALDPARPAVKAPATVEGGSGAPSADVDDIARRREERRRGVGVTVATRA